MTPEEITSFIHHDKFTFHQWNEIADELSKIPYCSYHQLEAIKMIPGYNLYQNKENKWHADLILCDVRTGNYFLKKEKSKVVNIYHQNNSFIFCLNGEINQFKNKQTHDELYWMARTIWFELTRLTIVEKIENEKFLEKK